MAQMVMGTKFEVDPSRYQIQRSIGQGAYGVVCAANDMKVGEKVAIKKIAKAFDHVTDGKRTLRELKLLRHFNHENVISIKDLVMPKSFEDFQDVYIVSELMDTDLHQIIGSPQALSEEHIQYFLYQLLRGLKYIHSANVLHRDLKPSNLLLNGNCDLKICDFGLARVSDPDGGDEGFLTEYVATRWYRAPEIMINWKCYTKAVDMWSVGCIFGELLTRKALFPGSDYVSQLRLITDVVGTPSEEELATVNNEKVRSFLVSLGNKKRANFKEIFPSASPLAIDLLENLLTLDPNKRLNVEGALAHPYLEALHDESDEPVAQGEFDFSFEKDEMNRDKLKAWIYKEIADFNKISWTNPFAK
eukprot:TRINITY_DN841_c0_g1_i2.p1 TRINITY_DN841_c0_g1~~TRINITY_DN841_c0_g1_i2.p1  ORF type:complete len:360 (-),score=94.18 TRINITY_DN841_c0_g1_i2:486-1565(-)